MKVSWKHSRGLSMPELMVAMTVLFIVSTFIMSMFVTGLRQTGQATQNQDLESLTRAKVSELSQMEWSALIALPQITQNFPVPYDAYSWKLEFSPLQGESINESRVCEVTVSHPDYGIRTGRTVRCNIVIDPGKAAWDKFGCDACHSLPGAGYDNGLLPLGPVPVGDPGFDGPRPVAPGPNGLKNYIKDSIDNPTGYNAYDPATEGVMQVFYVEGDPLYDPSSSDAFVRANSMSNAEKDALATWITTFQ